MIDVKKLITGFLILATAASMSALLLATSNQTPSAAATDNTASQIALTDTDAATTSPATLNAFLPPAPTAALDTATPADYSDIPLVDPSSTDSGNLTDVLADAYMNGVIQANPSGAQLDANGNPTFSDPDQSAIAIAMADNTDAASIEKPDWNYEADAQPIKVSAASSPADIQNYSSALTDIVNQHFVSSGVSNLLSADAPDQDQATIVATQLQQALGDTLALNVPKPLEDFQKSMITMMVYEKNMVALAATSTDDPVKTALIIQDEQGDYQAALANFQIQMQKAATLNGFSFGQQAGPTESSGVAFVDSLFGIQEAHAQYLTFDAANFGQWLLKFAEDLALQILKNTIVTLIQKKVLSWVQGSGAPRFVTQWGTTLINSLQTAALNAINNNMQCIYGPYAAQTRLDLQTYFNIQQNNTCGNTFQKALSGYSIQQFYKNFSSGGFVAYQASLMPSGNQFGNTLFAAQTAGFAGQNSQAGVSAKLTSAQGLTGDQVCDDGSNPNGIYYECQNPDGKDYNVTPPEKCDPSDTQVAQGNDGTCTDGTEPKVTTPGTFTGFGVSSALDSTPKLVTAANSIAGILSSMIASLMSTLANAAISAANSGVNQGISGLSGSGLQAGGGNPPPPLALQCTPPAQTDSSTVTVVIGATGGTNDANGNPPTYTWTSSDGAAISSSPIFSHAFALAGSYTVTLGDSANDAPATCKVTIQ